MLVIDEFRKEVSEEVYIFLDFSLNIFEWMVVFNGGVYIVILEERRDLKGNMIKFLNI